MDIDSERCEELTPVKLKVFYDTVNQRFYLNGDKSIKPVCNLDLSVTAESKQLILSRDCSCSKTDFVISKL